MSILGKVLSLIIYADFIQRFSPQSSHASEQDRLFAVILPPLSLIFIAGFAFRDDLRLIPQTTYGGGKGIVRALKHSAKHSVNDDTSQNTENDHADGISINDEEEQPTSSANKAIQTDYADDDAVV